MTSSAKMAPDSLGLELRKKIIGDYVSGMSQKSVCDKYRVKKWTVSRLFQISFYGEVGSR